MGYFEKNCLQPLPGLSLVTSQWKTAQTGSGRGSGISLKNRGAEFGIWLLPGSGIRPNWAWDATHRYEKKVGCGVLIKKEQECEISPLLPPPPPLPDSAQGLRHSNMYNARASKDFRRRSPVSCRCTREFAPPGPNPLADLVPHGGPNLLADLVSPRGFVSPYFRDIYIYINLFHLKVR